MPSRFHIGDRVALRDRPWQVGRTVEIPDGAALDLEALDGGHPGRLTVAVPPDRPLPLPNADLAIEVSAIEAFAPWTYAHHLLMASRVQGRTVCSGALYGRVALESYQLTPALRLLSKPRPSLLIADDVGLGKTIEAGLALLELEARGMVRRTLIVVPPGLLNQWEGELRERFGLRFTIIESAAGLAREQSRLPAGISPWDALPYVLTSIDYLKKDTVRARALRKRWDLAIVDEAHSLAVSGTPANPYPTQRARLGFDLREKARGLLLLTATPHNGYHHSFRSLIELVEPSAAALHGKEEHLSRRIRSAMVRRMKVQITRRNAKGKQEPVFLRRKVGGIAVDLEEAERELLKKVGSYCSKTARGAQKTEQAELVSFAMQIVKKRALSSRCALATTVENRLAALKGEQEEPPTQSELRDFAADIPQEESRVERTVSLILRSALPPEEKHRKAEISALNGIKRSLRGLPARDPKIHALVKEIREILMADLHEKVIVFTEYRDTLHSIEESLSEDKLLKGRYVSMMGGMTSKARQEVQDKFESDAICVLLATDAASEGLNLQRRCRRVIHVELPWNPNRMEQRNGRVDRYGQTRVPEIRYLFYPDSPEDDILHQLVAKIERMQQDEVSTPDLLGILSGAEDFSHRMALLDPENPGDAAEKTALVRLFEDRTRDFTRDVQPFLAAAHSNDASETLAGMSLESKSLALDDMGMEALVLGLLGPAAKATGQEGISRIEVPPRFQGPGVESIYPRATLRRSLAVNEAAEKLAFITPLHPLMRAMAAEARKKLLYAWPDDRSLASRRLAARRVPANELASAVITFFGQIVSGSQVLEERVMAVRIAPDLRIVEEKDSLRWLDSSGKPGEVPLPLMERLFAKQFHKMQVEAVRTAHSELRLMAESLQAKLRELAKALRANVDTDLADRLAEIGLEEKAYKGLVETGGQTLMFFEEERKAGGFDARRAMARSQAEARRKEVDAFEKIDEPAQPRVLGALLLVPETDR